MPPRTALSILHLHWLGDMSRARATSVRHLRTIEFHQRHHRCWYHDLQDPIGAELRRATFDAVVIDPTFLTARSLRPRADRDELLSRYLFLRGKASVKLAFPQDDYTDSEALVTWLNELGVDVVFTVLPEHASELLVGVRAEIQPALTGYVDDAVARVNPASSPLPLSQRSIEVGYRARALPAHFGRHGRMKTELGERFLAAARTRTVSGGHGAPQTKLDISVRPEDTLLGEAWPRFLEDCRFTLGCEGGSSVHDPQGVIADRVRDFTAAHPDASFTEIEAACFPGADRALSGQPIFSAISPRLFEAATANTAQILVPAPYLGVLQPRVHYVPVERDASNIDEVMEAVRDLRSAARMVEATRAALLEDPRFRYSTLALRIVDTIAIHASRKGASADAPEELSEVMRRDARVGRLARQYRTARDRIAPLLPPSLVPLAVRAKRRVTRALWRMPE